MHTNIARFLRTTLIISVVLLFIACSPAVVISIKPDASGTASFTAEINPTSENLVQRFSGNGGASASSPIFDRDKIVGSLARAGVKVDSLTFPTRTGIALDLSFLKLDGLLNQAIVVRKDTKSMEITLSRESVNEAINLMPDDTRDYLDLLMAPIFTGEEMDPREYEELIGAAYGKTLAEELKKSVFTLTVNCPQNVSHASVGTEGLARTQGKAATFTIPLSTLLAMQSTLNAKVEW